MKRYTVEIMNEASADMDQLYNHIAYVLQAPENTMDQYNWIADAKCLWPMPLGLTSR